MDFEIISDITNIEVIAGLEVKMERAQNHLFAVCLNNEDYEASLAVGKIYRTIKDKTAEANGLIRVIDESGEDYAFTAGRFCPIEVPELVQEALLKGVL